MNDALHCEVISTPEQLSTLRAEWNALAGTQDRIFLSQAWFTAAWEWAREHAQLHIVCGRRDGVLVGIAPLCRASQVLWGTRLRTVEFVTVPDTPYCDLIVAASEAEAFVAALLEHLESLRPRPHMIELVKLREDSPTPALLARALQARGSAAEACVPLTEYGVDLRSSWQAYYATRTRRLKKGNNLVANQLKRHTANVEFVKLPPPAAAIGDLLTRVSAGSWKGTTRNALDEPGPQRFLVRLLELAIERGALQVFALKLDGEPVASELQIIDGSTVYALRADFDQRFEKQSPGTYLNWKILEGLFDGTREHYAMGTGANPYKLRWANETRTLTGLRIYSRTPKASLVRVLEHRLRPFVRRLRARGGTRLAEPNDAESQ